MKYKYLIALAFAVAQTANAAEGGGVNDGADFQNENISVRLVSERVDAGKYVTLESGLRGGNYVALEGGLRGGKKIWLL